MGRGPVSATRLLGHGAAHTRCYRSFPGAQRFGPRPPLIFAVTTVIRVAMRWFGFRFGSERIRWPGCAATPASVGTSTLSGYIYSVSGLVTGPTVIGGLLHLSTGGWGLLACVLWPSSPSSATNCRSIGRPATSRTDARPRQLHRAGTPADPQLIRTGIRTVEDGRRALEAARLRCAVHRRAKHPKRAERRGAGGPANAGPPLHDCPCGLRRPADLRAGRSAADGGATRSRADCGAGRRAHRGTAQRRRLSHPRHRGGSTPGRARIRGDHAVAIGKDRPDRQGPRNDEPAGGAGPRIAAPDKPRVPWLRRSG